MARILFVDDEPEIRKMLRMLLSLAGLEGLEANSAETARKLLKEYPADLALVDIMMPGEDGFSLAGYLIEQNIPVLFLTAKTAVADRVRGLRMGAEDYILKPFEPEELVARIEVILRRTQPRQYEDEELLVDYDARRAWLNRLEIPLTSLEFDLLSLLTKNKGAAMSRDKLLSAVWGWDYMGETRTVDMHVQRLRAKIGAKKIETVYGYGYRWAGGSHT